MFCASGRWPFLVFRKRTLEQMHIIKSVCFKDLEVPAPLTDNLHPMLMTPCLCPCHLKPPFVRLHQLFRGPPPPPHPPPLAQLPLPCMSCTVPPLFAMPERPPWEARTLMCCVLAQQGTIHTGHCMPFIQASCYSFRPTSQHLSTMFGDSIPSVHSHACPCLSVPAPACACRYRSRSHQRTRGHSSRPGRSGSGAGSKDDNLRVCTFNCNGLLSLVPYAGSTEPRISQTCKFFYRSELHVMGVQEPRINTVESLLDLEDNLKKRNLSLLASVSIKGRGVVALIHHDTWIHVTSWTWSNRFLFVLLRDPDGMEHSFAICHFHHDASIQKTQWKKLSTMSYLIPRSTVFLSDHNSVILPSRDEYPPHPPAAPTPPASFDR